MELWATASEQELIADMICDMPHSPQGGGSSAAGGRQPQAADCSAGWPMAGRGGPWLPGARGCWLPRPLLALSTYFWGGWCDEAEGGQG